MLRSLFAIAATAILVGSLPTAAVAGQGFFDDDGTTHEASIEAIANVGITKGCNPPTNDRFCPNDPVTRGQMAAFLVRALSLPDGGPAGFGDTRGHTFEADIDRLAAAGITKGCNPPANDRFCPDDPVTRGQMAAFVVRALGLSDDGGGNRFVDDDGSVFEADIARLAAAGITKGCNPPANDRYCPDDPVTRGEMATFLTRALDLPTTPPPGFVTADTDLALVGRYHVVRRGDPVPYVRDAAYLPRSFDRGVDVDPDRDATVEVDSAGRYRGWDLLVPSTRWEFLNYAKLDDWFHFELTRPARVAVVWWDDEPAPSWLSDWELGGTVVIDGRLGQAYERDFGAGEVVLGSVEAGTEWRRMYLVLLAEAGGTPTPTPPAPPGFTAPPPNRPCPTWVHDRYTTTGPDGAAYQTWHPQIDPVYWCYFGHEHGSDPALIPGAPKVPYAYVSTRLGTPEPDAGFKEFTFRDFTGDYWVRFVVHGGTAGQGRVCARFHTLYVQVYDRSGNEMVNVGFKNDYGAAVATSASGGGVLTPTACGYSMPALAGQVDPLQNRSINIGPDSHDYERWDSRAETTATINLGLVRFEHEFDTRNPMSHCRNRTCDRVEIRDVEYEDGTRRTLKMASWRSDFVIDADHALGQGEFFTDPYGRVARSPDAADSVRQYVTPGFTLGFSKDSDATRIECVAVDPWTFEYRCLQLGDGESVPSPPDRHIEFSLWRN